MASPSMAGHELDFDPVAQDKADCNQQHAEPESQRRVAHLHDAIQRRSEDVVGKALDPGGDALLQSPPRRVQGVDVLLSCDTLRCAR